VGGCTRGFAASIPTGFQGTKSHSQLSFTVHHHHHHHNNNNTNNNSQLLGFTRYYALILEHSKPSIAGVCGWEGGSGVGSSVGMMKRPGGVFPSPTHTACGTHSTLHPTCVSPHPRTAAVLRVFSRPHTLPALVHCAHGKDRTGVIMLLLLAACGVPRAAIVGDYVEVRSWGLGGG